MNRATAGRREMCPHTRINDFLNITNLDSSLSHQIAKHYLDDSISLAVTVQHDWTVLDFLKFIRADKLKFHTVLHWDPQKARLDCEHLLNHTKKFSNEAIILCSAQQLFFNLTWYNFTFN